MLSQRETILHPSSEKATSIIQYWEPVYWWPMARLVATFQICAHKKLRFWQLHSQTVATLDFKHSYCTLYSFYSCFKIHRLTLSDPSSNPDTAREPSGDRAHDLAHEGSGIRSDFISSSPVMFHTYIIIITTIVTDSSSCYKLQNWHANK